MVRWCILDRSVMKLKRNLRKLKPSKGSETSSAAAAKPKEVEEPSGRDDEVKF